MSNADALCLGVVFGLLAGTFAGDKTILVLGLVMVGMWLMSKCAGWMMRRR